MLCVDGFFFWLLIHRLVSHAFMPHTQHHRDVTSLRMRKRMTMMIWLSALQTIRYLPLHLNSWCRISVKLRWERGIYSFVEIFMIFFFFFATGTSRRSPEHGEKFCCYFRGNGFACDWENNLSQRTSRRFARAHVNYFFFLSRNISMSCTNYELGKDTG